MSAVRMPVDMIATIVGMSRDTFERMMKTNAALRAAVDRGRANASGKIRTLAYQMCFDKEIPAPTRHQALKWWTATQEGFKTAQRLELTDLDGEPISLTNLTDEQLEERINQLTKRLNK